MLSRRGIGIVSDIRTCGSVSFSGGESMAESELNELGNFFINQKENDVEQQ